MLICSDQNINTDSIWAYRVSNADNPETHFDRGLIKQRTEDVSLQNNNGAQTY